MRFAVIAASAAAVVAVPFALQARAPEMSSEEFLTAVRCTAVEDASGAESASLAEARYQLNAEARRQAPETAAQARAAAQEARQAVNSGAGADQAIVCGGAFADGAPARPVA